MKLFDDCSCCSPLTIERNPVARNFRPQLTLQKLTEKPTPIIANQLNQSSLKFFSCSLFFPIKNKCVQYFPFSSIVCHGIVKMDANLTCALAVPKVTRAQLIAIFCSKPIQKIATHPCQAGNVIYAVESSDMKTRRNLTNARSVTMICVRIA